MSQLLEVTEYRYVRSSGVSSLAATGSVNIVPANVVKVHWETEDLNGNNNRFKVYMNDGRVFITDWAGTSSIQNWNAPFQNNI